MKEHDIQCSSVGHSYVPDISTSTAQRNKLYQALIKQVMLVSIRIGLGIS